MDVSNFRWTHRRETDVDFTWTTPELSSPFTNMTYNLTWIPNDAKSYSTTGNQATISNLISGQVYKFKLHFNLFDGQRWMRYTHEPFVTVRTSTFNALFIYLFICSII